jgi:hypothetical protein
VTTKPKKKEVADDENDIVDQFNQEHEQHKYACSLGEIISTFAKNVWIGMRDTMPWTWEDI